jgi:hypothetical protein
LNLAENFALPTLERIPFEVILHKLITPLAFVETLLISDQQDIKPKLAKAELALRRYRLLLETFLALKEEDKSSSLSLVFEGIDPSLTISLIKERLSLKQITFELTALDSALTKGELLLLLFLLEEFFWVRCSQGSLVVRVSNSNVFCEFLGKELINILPERDFEGALLFEYLRALNVNFMAQRNEKHLKLEIIFKTG